MAGNAPPGLRVVAFHKPPGLVTAARDPLPTIYSVLPFGPDALLPVGRLDRETEGLYCSPTMASSSTASPIPSDT